MNLELTDEEILRLLADGIDPLDLLDMSRRIVRNAIRCNQCRTVAESTHRHHMKSCQCGAVSADGGHAYLRRVFRDGAPWEEISEYEDLTEAEMRQVVDDLLGHCPASVDPSVFLPSAVAEFRAALEPTTITDRP